ncbi:MAG: hypothetical protein R3F55_24630 [Alphaproteobacteria bacterium]
MSSLVADDTITFASAVSIVAAGVGLTATAGDLITVNASVATNNGDITFPGRQFHHWRRCGLGSATVMFDRVTAGAFGLGFNGGVAVTWLNSRPHLRHEPRFRDPTAAANKITQLDIQGTFDLSGTISGLVQLNALNNAGSLHFALRDPDLRVGRVQCQ